MASLARDLRKKLEATVKEARRVAEAGAHKAVEQLAVHHHEPWGSMSPEARGLRNRLRAHGRQLGDPRDAKRGTQAIGRLTHEVAYEQWHRMLFARFLAETDLLIEPKTGVAITLAEAEELARERGEDWLKLASDFAVGMLPQIFRAGDPALEVTLPPETRSQLEDLLKTLPRKVFLADDSLGWVYQFWQAEKKDEINKSEKKIGADELPAVTQLFTEDYMVLFLLENTLGAWWAGKVLAANPALATTAADEDALRVACAVGDVRWTYLRFVREEDGPWRPAAGAFECWPEQAKDITVLDPCMGSGHFLVFALPILVAFRMAEEGLSRAAAVEAVLEHNLFGLEIDPRCTQIAAFNLAFPAWRMVGYRPLPRFNLACSGLAIGVSKAEWLRLAEKAVAAADPAAKRDLFGVEKNIFTSGLEARVKNGLEALYELFAQAPWLGSLIDPRRAGADIFREGFDKLEPLLASILAAADTDEMAEMAVAAQGLAKAAELLARPFTLVATNVPFLGRGKQVPVVQEHLTHFFKDAKADLATAMLRRLVIFAGTGGTVGSVTPQTWLFLATYREFRRTLLKRNRLHFIVDLGPAAFNEMNWWAARTALVCVSSQDSSGNTLHMLVDADTGRDLIRKPDVLQQYNITLRTEGEQLANPDSIIVVRGIGKGPLLSDYVDVYEGLSTGDNERYRLCFWEVSADPEIWSPFLSTNLTDGEYGGRHNVIRWEKGNGELALSEGARIQGMSAWPHEGILLSVTGTIRAQLKCAQPHEKTTVAFVPKSHAHLGAIFTFMRSEKYRKAARALNQKTGISTGIVAKVPFDLPFWINENLRQYPDGLPAARTTDPTQWLFEGQPQASTNPLVTATIRFLGYRWPRQLFADYVAGEATLDDGLERHADADGIVCLTATKGEAPAAGRLNALLSEAFGAKWSAAKLASLLSQNGFAGKTLDDWLRDGFFEQHCALFHQRPFVWHIWDGRRDGFHALVNYHRLAAPNGEGRRTLEKLIYSYLGDWTQRQRAEQKAGIEGADARLAAAVHLRAELIRILEGEPPYDIFVRWKPLHQQPIGWEPDINDGVRLNIRPFMTARPLAARAKGACILRCVPRIKWDKDRGKEPSRNREDYPWFWGWNPDNPNLAIDFAAGTAFDGNRWNDLHYTRAAKEVARARHQSS